MSKLRKVILAGLLLAASIVLNRFLSIKTPIVQISFTFIPTILTAMFLGTGWSVLVCGLADLLGALLFPFGAFFPGYTFTAIVTGLIYGLFLNKAYKKSGKQFLWRLALSCVLVSLICNLGLNTLWTWYLTKKAIVVILPTRLIKEAILLVIKILVMQGLHLTFMKSGAYKNLFKEQLEIKDENNENDKPSESDEIAENKLSETKSETNLAKTKKTKKKPEKVNKPVTSDVGGKDD